MQHTRKESSFDIGEKANSKDSGNGQLMEMEKIEDTPFTAVKYGDNWFLTMGKYRLTEPIDSKEAVMEMAQDTTWMRLLQVIKIMIDESREEQNNTPKQN